MKPAAKEGKRLESFCWRKRNNKGLDRFAEGWTDRGNGWEVELNTVGGCGGDRGKEGRRGAETRSGMLKCRMIG